MEFLQQYESYKKRQLTAIFHIKKSLETNLIILKQRSEEKTKIITKKQTEKELLKHDKINKEILLGTLSDKEKLLNNNLKLKRKQKADLEKKIQLLIQKEIAKNKDRSESQKKESIQVFASFKLSKGNLPMPIQGDIVSYYGIQNQGQIQIQNDGIGIKARNPQEPVRAVFEGKVSNIFFAPSFNHNIMINHGGYITVYQNVENPMVQVNQNVKGGELLGYIAPNENNEYITHFQVWNGMNRQNPINWIKSK